jgi:hypothetical protein
MSVSFPNLTKRTRIDPFGVTATSSDISFNFDKDFSASSTGIDNFENSTPGLVSEGYVNANFNPMPFSTKKLRSAEHFHTEFRNQLVFRIRSLARETRTDIQPAMVLAQFPRREYLATIQQTNLTLAMWNEPGGTKDLTLKDLVRMVAPMFVGIKPKNLFGRGLNGKLDTIQPGTVHGHCEMFDIFSQPHANPARHIREGDHLFIIAKKVKLEGLTFRPTLYGDNVTQEIEDIKGQAGRRQWVWQLEPWFSADSVGPSAEELLSDTVAYPAVAGVPAGTHKYVGHAFYLGWIKEIKTASHFRALHGGELLPFDNHKRHLNASFIHGKNPQRDMQEAWKRQTIVVQLELNSQEVSLPYFYDEDKEKAVNAVLP